MLDQEDGHLIIMETASFGLEGHLCGILRDWNVSHVEVVYGYTSPALIGSRCVKAMKCMKTKGGGAKETGTLSPAGRGCVIKGGGCAWPVAVASVYL